VEWGRRGNKDQNETIWGTIYVYMEMPQRSPVYNYHKQTKMVFVDK
jgi:hypothetical protein